MEALKLIRINHVPYMTKALRRAIMKSSELENKHIKKRQMKTLNLIKKTRISAVNYILL